MSTDAATTPPLSALGLAIDPTIIGLGAALAIGLAATSNMLVKAGMAWFTGGSELGRRVVIGYSAALTVGGLAIALTMLT